MNLSNVSEDIKRQIEAVKEHAKELTTDVATWWNFAQTEVKGFVEQTKKNISANKYDGILGTLAKEDDVDPLLILSIITIESKGNPNAKNSLGYIGCMQVDPKTYGIPSELSSDTLVNAQNGIEGGIRAIYDKYNSYPNNIYLLIASYNAGQGTVYEATKHLEDEKSLMWWNTIEYIAATAKEQWPGANKWDEIGRYAICVMYAYMLYAGYEIKIGKLPQAHDPSKKSDISKFMTGGLSSPANPKPIVGPPQPHGKHKDYEVSAPPKLYCEPVYPDYICLSDEIPPEISDINAKADSSEMIVGENLFYSIPTSTLIKYGGENYVGAMTMNTLIEQQHKKAFNPEEHRHAYKVPSSGKPANNDDPFPVDAKIEEMEMHTPRCKIKKIKACEQALTTAKATIQLSMNTEKRLVKLENNIATILRYLNRLGSRVPINCVYYGGQCTSEKYKCIRCMKDDRLSDGQFVSIDQCLNCTRYEPIIGQVYDILNDSGLNLSKILDDNQMSYTTMEEYCNFVSATDSQQPLETTDLKADSTHTRLINETDFDEDWPQGIKMKWDLFPVEDQKPHINARQSIKESGYDKLASSAYTVDNYGSAFTGDMKSNKIVENYKQIEAYSGKGGSKSKDPLHDDIIRIITEAKEEVIPNMEQYVNDMRSYLSNNINNLTKGKKLDNVLVAAIVFASGVGADMVVKDMEELQKKLSSNNINNLVLLAVFINFETNLLFGKDEKTPDVYPVRLDRVKHVIDDDDENGSTRTGFGLDWNKINDWDWLDFVEPLNINYFRNEKIKKFDDKMKIFVKVAYIYMELRSKCSTSRFDNLEMGLAFPFFEEQLDDISYTSPFGWRIPPIGGGDKTFHHGVDLAAEIGTEVHCIADGTVEWVLPDGEQSNGGGNMVCVRHSAELTSRYMHLVKIEVSAGQSLKKGEVFAHTGNTGASSGPHLHFEVQIGGTTSSCSRNPCEFYPLLQNIPLGSKLSSL